MLGDGEGEDCVHSASSSMRPSQSLSMSSQISSVGTHTGVVKNPKSKV